jgi:hypothetical protein
MKPVPTSWLYQGKNFRKLTRLETLDRDSLFHSILTCLYPIYQKQKILYDKFLYISRFKMSLLNHKNDYEEYIRKDDYKNLLKEISNLFEINIYLMKCRKDDTLIEESFQHDTESPIILIEKCSLFYPLAIEEKNGIHTIFFKGIDDDIKRCLRMFEESGISEKYEDSIEKEITIDMKHIFKYDIYKYLNSLKHKKLKK